MQDDWLTDLLQTTPTEPTGAIEHATPDLTTDHLATSHASLTHHSLEPDLTGHPASMPHLDAPSWHHYPATMYSPAHTASGLTTSAGGDSSDPNGNAWDWTVAGLSAPHATFDPAHPGGVVVGDPAAAAAHWQPQHMPDSCVSIEPDRVLYLAVPFDIYDEFFQLGFIQKVIQRTQLKILIYDEQKEEILQWQS